MWSLFRVWEKTFDMIFRSLIRFDSEQTKSKILKGVRFLRTHRAFI